MYRYLYIYPIEYPKSVSHYIENWTGKKIESIPNDDIKTFLTDELKKKENYEKDEECSRYVDSIIPEDYYCLSKMFWDKAMVLNNRIENKMNFYVLMTFMGQNDIDYRHFDDYIFSIGAATRLDHALPKFVIDRSKTKRVLVILFNPDGMGWGKINKSDIDRYINTLTDSELKLTVIDTSFNFHSKPLSTEFFNTIVRDKSIFVLDFISGEYNPGIFIALKSHYGLKTNIRYVNGFKNFVRTLSTNNRDLINVYELEGVTHLNWKGPCYYENDSCPINTLSYDDFRTNATMTTKIKSVRDIAFYVGAGSDLVPVIMYPDIKLWIYVDIFPEFYYETYKNGKTELVKEDFSSIINKFKLFGFEYDLEYNQRKKKYGFSVFTHKERGQSIHYYYSCDLSKAACTQRLSALAERCTVLLYHSYSFNYACSFTWTNLKKIIIDEISLIDPEFTKEDGTLFRFETNKKVYRCLPTDRPFTIELLRKGKYYDYQQISDITERCSIVPVYAGTLKDGKYNNGIEYKNKKATNEYKNGVESMLGKRKSKRNKKVTSVKMKKNV